HARKATLRILIGPRWQGQGYGSAALRQLIGYCFDELGLRRLGLVVRADNARALGVYQRLGFVAEGRERDAAWVNGHWIDFIHMGLLAPDWRDERADPMVGYVAGAELTQAVAHPTTPKREGE
ncbi:MAG TPA: GNAT family protein, partial [Ktedonobacterales bacterium]|nr:GNAT family protein [Ktedonobacterales bacterium]